MEEKHKVYNEMMKIPDQEAMRMIRVLAEDDRRDMGHEVAELIHLEYNRRYPTAEKIAERFGA